MRSITRMLLLIALISANVASSKEFDKGINVSIDVSSILSQLGEWIKDGYGEWQEAKQISVQRAIPSLIADYLQIAAKMDQVAQNIEDNWLPYDKPRSWASTLLYEQMTQLRSMMRDIAYAAANIDPDWVTNNPLLEVERSMGYAARGIVIKETGYLLEYPARASQLTKDELGEIARKLRVSASETRDIALDLAATVPDYEPKER